MSEVLINDITYVYQKIFYIRDATVFKNFKEFLKTYGAINLFTDYDVADFKKFKFNKDKPYYRITNSKSYGCSTLEKYKTYEQYANYNVFILNGVDISSKKLDYIDLHTKLKDMTDAIINASTYYITPEMYSSMFTTCAPISDVTVGNYSVPYISTATDCGWDRSITDTSTLPTAYAVEDLIKSYNKEKDAMKLLDIYKERTLNHIKEIIKEKIETTKLKDKTYATASKLGASVQYVGELPDTILDEIDKLQLEEKSEIAKLEDLVKEISAQLEICETYEQKINVLKLYNILNEEGKLNI